LEGPLEIVGFPELELELAVYRPLALLCVRLCDVAPEGASLLITRGLLNLAHRDGHESPTPLEPGRRYTVLVGLDAIAHHFRAGHRIRVAVSPTYWPLAWPSPEPVTLTLFPGGDTRLVLPVRPESSDHEAPQLPEPEEPQAYAERTLRHDQGRRALVADQASGRSVLRFDWDQGGRIRLEASGTELEYTSGVEYSIVEGEPLSARVDCDNGVALERGADDWYTRARATGTMTTTATHFCVTTALEAFERETRIWAKSWTFTIPRDHV
jgi:hypothetical protein